MVKRFYWVDAFTDRPYTGNPAAVCLLEQPGRTDWMQALAAEINLSETAFLHPGSDGYDLRWFTPGAEVDLCGHATLASAHVLWSEGFLSPGKQARFQTRSGLLTALQLSDGWIELEFPQTPEEEAPAPAGLIEALGVKPLYVGRSRFDYLIEVYSEETVRLLKPDFARMKEVKTRGVMVTSRADSPDLDFVSRFFAPSVGVDEDPVTGSAHCCLGPFWQTRLRKNELSAFQASARGGRLLLRIGREQVYIRGQAVTLVRGELS